MRGPGHARGDATALGQAVEDGGELVAGAFAGLDLRFGAAVV